MIDGYLVSTKHVVFPVPARLPRPLGASYSYHMTKTGSCFSKSEYYCRPRSAKPLKHAVPVPAQSHALALEAGEPNSNNGNKNDNDNNRLFLLLSFTWRVRET